MQILLPSSFPSRSDHPPRMIYRCWLGWMLNTTQTLLLEPFYIRVTFSIILIGLYLDNKITHLLKPKITPENSIMLTFSIEKDTMTWHDMIPLNLSYKFRGDQFVWLLFEPYSLSEWFLFVPVWSSMMKAPHIREPPCDMADASSNLVHPLIDRNDISWLGGIHSVFSQAWPITMSFPHKVLEHLS